MGSSLRRCNCYETAFVGALATVGALLAPTVVFAAWRILDGLRIRWSESVVLWVVVGVAGMVVTSILAEALGRHATKQYRVFFQRRWWAIAAAPQLIFACFWFGSCAVRRATDVGFPILNWLILPIQVIALAKFRSTMVTVCEAHG